MTTPSRLAPLAAAACIAAALHAAPCRAQALVLPSSQEGAVQGSVTPPDASPTTMQGMAPAQPAPAANGDGVPSWNADAAPTPAAPSAPPASSPAASTGPGPDGSFAIMGGRMQGDWKFYMGPSGSPQESLTLALGAPDGAAGFRCTMSDGSMLLDMGVRGMDGVDGQQTDVRLTVGDRTDTLHVVRVTEAQGAHPAVFETSGPAIPDILRTMGRHPIWDPAARLVLADNEGHSLALPLPDPRDMALAASSICQGWADKAAHAALAAAQAAQDTDGVGGAAHVPESLGAPAADAFTAPALPGPVVPPMAPETSGLVVPPPAPAAFDSDPGR